MKRVLIVLSLVGLIGVFVGVAPAQAQVEFAYRCTKTFNGSWMVRNCADVVFDDAYSPWRVWPQGFSCNQTIGTNTVYVQHVRLYEDPDEPMLVTDKAFNTNWHCSDGQNIRAGFAAGCTPGAGSVTVWAEFTYKIIWQDGSVSSPLFVNSNNWPTPSCF